MGGLKKGAVLEWFNKWLSVVIPEQDERDTTDSWLKRMKSIQGCFPRGLRQWGPCPKCIPELETAYAKNKLMECLENIIQRDHELYPVNADFGFVPPFHPFFFESLMNQCEQPVEDWPLFVGA